MIHVFYKNRNTIGQFMVALIFLGTFGFLFTYDGFVAESTATSCCGGGEAAVTSFAADSSGDFGGDVPMDAETLDSRYSRKGNIPFSSDSNGDSDCKCIGSSCGDCGSSTCSGASSVSCDSRCDESCPNQYKSCCSTKGDKYCPNDEYADKECCEVGDCD